MDNTTYLWILAWQNSDGDDYFDLFKSEEEARLHIAKKKITTNTIIHLAKVVARFEHKLTEVPL